MSWFRTPFDFVLTSLYLNKFLIIIVLNRQRTPSGSTTPVRGGQQTAVSRLLRKPSDASDSGAPTTSTSRRGTPTTKTEKREPFRL